MPDNSLAVDYNMTQVLKIPNVYNNVSFVNDWVYVGVSFSQIFAATDLSLNVSKVSAYVYGPKGEASGQAIFNDYYGETTAAWPYYY